MKMLRAITLLAAVLGVAHPAFAQTYPAKPVHVVLTFSPGSAIDVIGRAVAQKLAEIWAQPVVVENRVGGGGVVGADAVAKSAPDGYTLLLTTNAFAANPALRAKMPYDTLKDFTPVTALVSQPYLLVTGASSGVKSVAELIAAAKGKPGELNFASTGLGASTHLVAEKFNVAAGIDAVHVPYKGGPEANADTMVGRVAYWFPPVAVGLPLVRSGKLIALGSSGKQRSSLLPGVPTIAEAGVGGFSELFWTGIWAPAGTPAAVVDKLALDVARALAMPDLRERLTQLGSDPMSMTQAEFARFVKDEVEGTARIAKAAGIKPE